VSQLNSPTDRAHEVLTEIVEHKGTATVPEEHKTSSLTMKELEIAIHTLIQRKSPGKYAITNDMLKRLWPVAETTLLKLMNTIWKRGIVPQVWKWMEAKVVRILPKRQRQTRPKKSTDPPAS
jgi:hypothetical protein